MSEVRIRVVHHEKVSETENVPTSKEKDIKKNRETLKLPVVPRIHFEFGKSYIVILEEPKKANVSKTKKSSKNLYQINQL